MTTVLENGHDKYTTMRQMHSRVNQKCRRVVDIYILIVCVDSVSVSARIRHTSVDALCMLRFNTSAVRSVDRMYFWTHK